MALTTRAGKGSKLNSVEMDTNILELSRILSSSDGTGIIQVTGSTIQAPNTSITASFFRGDGRALTNVTASYSPAAGSNTQIQYNNNGILGAEAAFTYDASANALTVTNIVAGDIQIAKAIDAADGYLLDGAELTSIDWKNRALKYTGGATAVDWTTDNRLILSSSQMVMKGLANTNQGNIISIEPTTGRLYYMSTSSLSPITASSLTTASAVNNIITFTKGNGSTFDVTVATGSGGSAFPFSGNAIITGSLFISQSGSNPQGNPGIGIVSNQGSIYVYDNPSLAQYRTIRVQDAGGYGDTIMSLDQLSINNLYGNLELLLSGSYTNVGYENRTMLKHTSNIGANLFITSNTKIILSGSLGAVIDSSLSQGSNTTASGQYSHAEGSGSEAQGNYSHAEGRLTLASNLYSHAEGRSVLASGQYSHAEGWLTTASQNYSHAEGIASLASGLYSHAEGSNTFTSGQASHAEGYFTSASGNWSHAEGYQTIALGQSSHTEGLGTIASGSYQNVVGQYNAHNDNTSYFIVGGGTDDSTRKDAFKVTNSSSIVVATQSAAPGWTGKEGEMVPVKNGASYFIYVYIGGAWKSASLA
jgi:hypothetical protein